MNYNFNQSYYENFLRNRVAGITGSGSLNNTLKQLVFPNMPELGDGTLGTIDFKSYVKRTYNGDRPICIDEKVKNAINDAGSAISTWDDAAAGFIDNALGTDISSWKL